MYIIDSNLCDRLVGSETRNGKRFFVHKGPSHLSRLCSTPANEVLYSTELIEYFEFQQFFQLFEPFFLESRYDQSVVGIVSSICTGACYSCFYQLFADQYR